MQFRNEFVWWYTIMKKERTFLLTAKIHISEAGGVCAQATPLTFINDGAGGPYHRWHGMRYITIFNR
jgi:hypothetical protein